MEGWASGCPAPGLPLGSPAHFTSSPAELTVQNKGSFLLQGQCFDSVRLPPAPLPDLTRQHDVMLFLRTSRREFFAPGQKNAG